MQIYHLCFIKIIIINFWYDVTITITSFLTNTVYLLHVLLVLIYTSLQKILINTYYKVVIYLFDIIYIFYSKTVYLHWDIRKTYQTFLYRFNSYHELNLFKRKVSIYYNKFEYKRLFNYSCLIYYSFFKNFIIIIQLRLLKDWYLFCWCGWCCLTIILYYNEQVRDLGPSYDIYDYNPEDDMGVYLTIGPFMLISWLFWTFSANTAFTKVMLYLVTRFVRLRLTWKYWYLVTIYSFIEMPFFTFFDSILNTISFIVNNFITLLILNLNHVLNVFYIKNSTFVNNLLNINSKLSLLWFPWDSFFNYITILGLFYTLTFLSIYNTENSYYLVLYLVFLVFLFSATLVLMDLDIFAGLLLLIESVVILMLFFLIIYLTPNTKFTAKINSWKIIVSGVVIITFLTFFSYIGLGNIDLNIFTSGYLVLDDFYEALNDVFISELTGVYVSLYWTNSLLLFLIGVLLLIASIICVVLVSFFTKMRNFNYYTFLDFFNIAKNCYSFIFLRKQNLVKQGRGITSTRIFAKKVFDSSSHSEYKEKQEIFETIKKKEN